MNNTMSEIVEILERQGYKCYIAACGNGFYSRDMEEDDYYDTRKTLESYGVGKVNKIACPTPQTAAKMANDAEFSIIFADFDGLSSICKMASLCQKDKVPYFLSTENRYSWNDPTEHNWVDPEWCEYDKTRIYDISIDDDLLYDYYEKEEEYTY